MTFLAGGGHLLEIVIIFRGRGGGGMGGISRIILIE
jgi:hypothetical protein